jgi:outer membrane protein, heavy metal efflux system
VSGRIGSESKSETQISLLFPIELGGKRLARKAVAVAESTIAEAEVGEVRSNVVIQTILNLHRLRQIESERKILVEAKRAFERIFGQQKARVGLSPEQRVATSLYNLSSAEAVVRLSELDEEERGLEHYFHLATGNSLSELRKFLPATPTLWPSLPVANNEFLSPGKMKAMAGVKVSNAQTLSSRAAVWPDFFFGPMAQIESENGQRGSIFGLQLTLGLPILSLNNAGRAFAALGQTRATRGSELTFSEEKHEREEQARIYLQAVEVLKAAPSADDLQRLHRDQERFGNQGLLSPALTIESHRKIEELTISRHQRELKALNALWQIRKYDGRIFTEKL